NQMILKLALLGVFGFAGLHRFILGQIGLGILYFLTLGLCYIGTIVDMVNYKSLAYEFNIKIAHETLSMMANNFDQYGIKPTAGQPASGETNDTSTSENNGPTV